MQSKAKEGFRSEHLKIRDRIYSNVIMQIKGRRGSRVYRQTRGGGGGGGDWGYIINV